MGALVVDGVARPGSQGLEKCLRLRKVSLDNALLGVNVLLDRNVALFGGFWRRVGRIMV